VSIVLDSSTALSWLFEDEESEHSSAVLEKVVEQGAVAPVLWRYEIGNALEMAVRRNRITATYRDQSLARLDQLGIHMDANAEQLIWSTTVPLASRTGLTVYDAAYLELANRLQLPLATLDGQLRLAATAEGVSVI
jgi:predicted nucleic acid-binding protein